MQITLNLDESLLNTALQLTDLSTKEELVNLALQELVRSRRFAEQNQSHKDLKSNAPRETNELTKPNSQTDLKALSIQFWQDTTIDRLAATQTPKTVGNLKDLAADFWPEEDSIDDFLSFLQQQRQGLV